MTFSVLITSTSFMETPGLHLEKFRALNYDLTVAKGPLDEDELINIIKNSSGFDGLLCGRDNLSSRVLEAFSPRLKVISRYGVGLDRIDLDAASKLGITLKNTTRLNHTTVSELTFGLLIALSRRLQEHSMQIKNSEWKRLTGYELRNKVLAICGFGMVGREVAKIALSFGMKVRIYNSSWGEVHENYFNALKSSFSNPLLWDGEREIERFTDSREALSEADFISLHMDLNRNNMHFINRESLKICKEGVFIVNVSRGGLVDEEAMVEFINSGKVSGFASDVLEQQTPKLSNPLINLPNVIITPHLGGRTFESVVKQGVMAVDNLITGLITQDN